MQTKVSKNICTGCGACFNICPKNAIEMKEDEEGFLFPVINKDFCVNCNMCEKVCPAINNTNKNLRQEYVYALRADNELRSKSSSGGIFGLLANEVLEKGGFVVGVAFKENFGSVGHIIISDKKDLWKLQSSKYVQSDAGNCYTEAKKLLDEGKLVLFSGTPCEIAGLKNLLGKDYDNLLTVEVLCHGAPSPKIWREYLKEITNGAEIKAVNFRYKKRFGFKYHTNVLKIICKGKTIVKKAKESAYYIAFGQQNVILRKSCGNCKFTTIERVADITLGDFWGFEGYNKKLEDYKGTSLYIANSPKGKASLDLIKPYLKLFEKVPVEYTLHPNPALRQPPIMHPQRERFFMNKENEKSMVKRLNKAIKNENYDGIIANFWDAIGNYGAMLTAWALQEFFADKGYDYRHLMFNYNKKRKTYKKSPNYLFANRYLKLAKRVNSPRDFKKLSKNIDNFVVGSDQVFRECFLKKNIEYFLFPKTDFEKRRVAFSASFGESSFNTLPQNIKLYKTLFKRFDAISTREKSGVEILKHDFDVEAEHIIDPVFLIDKSKYDIFIDKNNDKYKNKIVSYMFFKDAERQQEIQNFAKEHGMEVVEFVNSNVSVEEFLTALYHCEYVFTDSFHGTCFSIILHKKFKCFACPGVVYERFKSLFETFKIDNPSSIDWTQDDWDNIESIISSEKEKTDIWFKKVFETPLVKTDAQIENEKEFKKLRSFKPKKKFEMFSYQKLNNRIIIKIFGIKATIKSKNK